MENQINNTIRLKLMLLLLLIAGAGYSTSAQITINKSDMPSVNDTVRSSTGLNLDFIDYTETGEDFLWDFSQLLPIKQRVDTFLSPLSLPLTYWGFAFSSDFGVKGFEGLPIPGFPFGDEYDFYKKNNDGYRATGIGISIFNFPFPIFYDAPDLVYGFPMGYGSNWASQSHFAQELPSVGYLKMTRTHVDTVDGWGTLITPYGTFEVLRLKSEVTENDSIYLDSLEVGIPVTRNYTLYQWLGKGQKIPLLQIASNLGGVLVEYVDSARVIINGINEEPFVRNNDFQVFPNPTSNRVQLQFEMLEKQEADIKLFDVYGREVQSVYKGVLPQGKASLTFSFKSLNLGAGYYFVQLRAGNSALSKKIIYKPSF
ncbi:MAG: T9SS type A sorting domain-containing protein [Bacteroidales bacterium]|nr:T9SS type A sorting domain-containing protein [Bacteroidales bacterium]